MASTATTHHMRHWNKLKARSIVWNKECRKARVLVAFLIGYCNNISKVRTIGMGNEPFFTIQDIRTIRLFLCSAVKVCAGTARFFSNSKVAINRLVLELVHVLCFEFWLAIIVKNTPIHVSRMMKMHAHSARSTRELFLNLQNFELVQVPSTVFCWKIETIQVVFFC